jgi:thiamine-monophosphate kinase
MADEFDLIRGLQQRVSPHRSVAVGIGDDTAVLRRPQGGSQQLVTVDLVAEGTHFTLPEATPAQIAHKALAVNLSDIAAMAGSATAAFVAVALNRSLGSPFAEELFAGLHAAAARFGVTIAGGDTNIWTGPLVVSITLLGESTGSGPVLRSGAQPGDWLFVTGALGGSLAGRHLQITPRLEEAARLHELVNLHAMIDLSDGLSRDVKHITTEQGLGFALQANRIPIHGDVPGDLPQGARINRALHDGEDFELLFAVSPEDGRRLLSSPPFDTALAHVGIVLADPARGVLVDEFGQESPLVADGYEHRF